jgi:hypothetical protein
VALGSIPENPPNRYSRSKTEFLTSNFCGYNTDTGARGALVLRAFAGVMPCKRVLLCGHLPQARLIPSGRLWSVMPTGSETTSLFRVPA